MGQFKKLRVWQDAIALTEKIYRTTEAPGFAQDYALKNQIRRAAISVASNIAEGDERGSNRASIQFFNIAKGSVAEVMTQLYIANKIGYLTQDEYDALEKSADLIRASLKNLIKARSLTEPPP